jgi:SAM-dependent methyltransferase
MEYTGERVVPWAEGVGANVLACHVARYAWAVGRTYGKRVVDLGCGTGYGSFMMSWGARSVVGVDVDTETVLWANAWFGGEKVRFAEVDLQSEPAVTEMVAAYPADVYVAFEVLEHLRPELVLRQCRPLLWSMPVGDASRYHRAVYSVDEIDALMERARMPVGQFFQAEWGGIAPRGVAWFEPRYVIGDGGI